MPRRRRASRGCRPDCRFAPLIPGADDLNGKNTGTPGRISEFLGGSLHLRDALGGSDDVSLGVYRFKNPAHMPTIVKAKVHRTLQAVSLRDI